MLMGVIWIVNESARGRPKGSSLDFSNLLRDAERTIFDE